jgi:polygalacturonase
MLRAMNRLLFPLTFLLAHSLPLFGGDLLPYASTPDTVPSQDYSVTVNGQSIAVEKMGDVSYARFRFTGEVQVSVKTPQPITDSTISPVSYQIVATKSGDTLAFPLREPRSLIITVGKLDKLLLFADPPEKDAPNAQAAGVTNLATYLPADRSPETPVTEAFQKAIDETSARNHGAGGILYVPNGKYLAGQLTLRSNVHLFLQDGALVKSVGNFSPTNYPRQGTNPIDSSFIFISDAKNVSISGRGVIDGNGLAVRQSDRIANVKLLRAVNCTNLRVSGVHFRNSSRWSLHILHSEDVVFQDFKLINDVRGQPTKEGYREFLVTNTDGVDIDASNQVTIKNSFIYTGDDATTIKVTGYLKLQRPCHDITIENNVLWSYKCGIRIGNESREDLHDITFRNNDMVHSDRAIAIYSEDGGRLFNINIFNNRTEFVGSDANERIFMLRVATAKKNSRPGSIDRVVIKDFFALQPAKQNSSADGFDATGKVTNVTLENIVIGGKPAKTLQDIPFDQKDFTENITLR